MASKKIRSSLKMPSVAGRGKVRGLLAIPVIAKVSKPKMVSTASLKKGVANKLGRKRFGPLSKGGL